MASMAVIGIGYWGPNLVRNFASLGAFDQVIACDRDPKRLEAVRRQLPGTELCADAAEVFRRPDVQAVAIATPVRTHHALAKAALEAGKHVLLEKPMTEDSRQGQELIDLAARRGLTLMVDHTFLFTGAVEKIREIVARGDLGDKYYVDSARVNLGLFQSDVDVIWDLAPHDLSIVGHVFGVKPRVVRAIGRSHAGGTMVDVAYLHVDYGDGFSAAFHVNWLSPTKIRRMIFAGSKKMIVWDDLEATEKVRVYDKGVELQLVGEEDKRRIRFDYRTGDAWLPRLDTTEALRKMAGHFVDSFRNGKKPICGGEEGLDVVRILEASRASLQQDGQAVVI